MSLRDQRQQEFAEQWLESKRFSIMYLCPRFGKIFNSINILEQLNPHCTVLVAYPDNKIRHSWEEDFKKREYNNPNVTFTTHLSLKKYVDKIFDIVILDEIHLLSDSQIDICKELFKENRQVLGLTGTMSQETTNTLWNELKLPVLATYSIAQAIEEGVITDYEITIVHVPLDNKIKLSYKGRYKTEKQKFDELGWVINKMEKEGRDTMFMRLARMRIIQSSLAKLNKTIDLLHTAQQERILVFCGTIAIAENLGIPCHHSKSGDKELFNAFVNGRDEINHMAVVRIGNTGVTYTLLNKVIINYFGSNAENLAQKINRCMSMEYDNPNKKANIWIVSTTEPVEAKWLNKALEFFDKQKIKYI